MAQTKTSGDSRLRNVPSVDRLIRTDVAIELATRIGIKRVTALARLVTSEIRTAVQSESESANGQSAESLLINATQRLEEAATSESRLGIRKVINATGVVLHTNLGRAPSQKLPKPQSMRKQLATALLNTTMPAV